MRALLILGLSLVALSSTLVKAATGYHEKIGIPLAKKIKEAEENMSEAVQTRITGGSAAPDGAHPYFAGLKIEFIDTADQSVCGSTLLSADRLVTAAHCWNDGNKQGWRFTVNLGSNLFFTCGTCIVTYDVVMHPQHSDQIINDIAMIKLPTKVEFSNRIQPISLPTGAELFWTFAGYRAVVTGYGITIYEEPKMSEYLKQLDVVVINDRVCVGAYGGKVNPNVMICTSGRGGIGPCPGDSGGPLIFNRNGTQLLIGVVSWGSDYGCQVGMPAVYTRVTSSIDFIQQHLRS